MNKDDVIRWAREASNNSKDALLENGDDLVMLYLDELERFAQAAYDAGAAHVRETEFKPDWLTYQQGLADGAAAEREALEKIDWTALLREGALVTWGDAATLAERVFYAIRARGETK